ncbi:unnamed protein product [Closterium sp. Yama58-4]|nr:unnamed protein product [Closterium sp. Yama58-4]
MGKEQNEPKEQPLVLFAGLVKGCQLIASYSQQKSYEQAALEAMKEVPSHVHRFSLGHGGVMALFCKFPDPLSLDGGSNAVQPSSRQTTLLTPSNSYGAVLIAYESPNLMRARGFELLRSMSDLYQTLLTRPRFPLRRTTSSFLSRADGFKRGKLEAQMRDMCAAERGLRCSQELRMYPMAPKAFLVRDSYQSAEDLAAIEALREEVEAKKERAKNMLEAELQFVNNMADDDICSLPGTFHLGESADADGDGDGDSKRGGEAAAGSGAQSAAYNPDVGADSDDEHEDLVPKSMPGEYYLQHTAPEPAAAAAAAVAAPHGAVSRGGSSRALSFSLSFSHSRSRPREPQVDVDDLASRWLRGNRGSLLPADAARVSPASDAAGGTAVSHSAELIPGKRQGGERGVEGGALGESLEEALAKSTGRARTRMGITATTAIVSRSSNKGWVKGAAGKLVCAASRARARWQRALRGRKQRKQ